MFGVVPGTEKVKYHTRFPDTMDISKMLFDLTELSGVDLFLGEGIIGMEGRGPSQGNPREVGVLISGTDPYLIDLHVARLTGLDPKKLPIMRSMKEKKRITFDQSGEKIKLYSCTIPVTLVQSQCTKNRDPQTAFTLPRSDPDPRCMVYKSIPKNVV